MLDIRQPKSKAVFAASRSLDEILNAAKKISINNYEGRIAILKQCEQEFIKLHALAQSEFFKTKCLESNIDRLKSSLTALANMSIPSWDTIDAKDNCQVCGTILDKREFGGWINTKNPTVIYCSPCLDTIMPALCMLRSSENGFGTDAI